MGKFSTDRCALKDFDTNTRRSRQARAGDRKKCDFFLGNSLVGAQLDAYIACERKDGSETCGKVRMNTKFEQEQMHKVKGAVCEEKCENIASH